MEAARITCQPSAGLPTETVKHCRIQPVQGLLVSISIVKVLFHEFFPLLPSPAHE